MEKQFLGHTIGAYRLAGQSSHLFWAFIDGMLDCDIQPSVYPKVVIRRIENAYAMRFIFENRKG